MAPNGALPANYRVGIESSRLRARSDRFHDKRFDSGFYYETQFPFCKIHQDPSIYVRTYPRELDLLFDESDLKRWRMSIRNLQVYSTLVIQCVIQARYDLTTCKLNSARAKRVGKLTVRIFYFR